MVNEVKTTCIIALIIIGFWSCEKGPSGTQRNCEVDYSVTIYNDTIPKISWEPSDCWLYHVIVTDEHDVMYWEVRGHGNSIEPPVYYGITPRNSTASSPDTLIIGQNYNVRLYLLAPPWMETLIDSVWFQYLESGI